MANTKILKKQKKFLLSELPIKEVKVGSKVKIHAPLKILKDAKFISDALMECLWDGDVKSFKEILRSHYEALNISSALRKTGLSKRTFYEALSKDGNPRLETVAKIIQGLKAA